MAKIIDGRRGGRLLAVGGYVYSRNKVRGNIFYWRCCDCHLMVQTEFFDVNNPPDEIDVANENEHEHPTRDGTINKQVISSRMKDAVKTNPSAPLKRVYDASVAEEERRGNNVDDVPMFGQIQYQLKRVKSANVPAIPHDVQDVEIIGTWGLTWQGQDNLIGQDNDWGIILFGTSRNLRLLQHGDTIFADGTFRSCPRPYTQMFTIHVLVNGHIICCVTCLMVNKDIGSYRAVIQQLKLKIRYVTGRRWRPTSVVVDFEQASIAAFQTEFPNISIKGCFFHLNQSIWRAIQRLGLVNAYRNNRRIKKLVKKMMALGFLPLLILRINFDNLVASPRTLQLFHRIPALRELFEYFRRNYLDGNFPPNTWNVFTRPMNIRTNNTIESYHSRWNKAVGVRHPSLWQFIRVLKDQQAVNNVNIRAIRNGEEPPRRRRKWRLLENRIETLKTRYNQGDMNINAYWRAVCHLIYEN